jgi:anti-sigma factor RsiW
MSTMNHPRENDLALLAGGEAGRGSRFFLERHVRSCADCQHKVAEYQQLRAHLREHDIPDANWHFLEADMRANIRLGLEAGACVRTTQITPRWNLRLTVGFASLAALIVAGFFVRDIGSLRDRFDAPSQDASTTVLRSTGSEVEIRNGDRSLMLLNHKGSTATNQTVSARGDIGTRYVDGEAGTVTINNVYLQ